MKFASEYLKYTQNASAATVYPVKPSYVTTSPLYRGSAFARGYTSTSTTSAATNIYSENSTLPFASDLKRYYESLFQNSYKAMVAACMVFVNFFFPIMNRTICDVSVNHPSAYLRVWDFALRTFNIVDKESPELVNATIKCIEMPTDKRDYLYVLGKFLSF
ncbi:hypothetical protein HPULCUR_003745 [Helicostylum pulchrum]|uniref:Uncharacterized protein n=1 Tax=Helicostylum pulchrum TaxID=562976 RepID=A0ABP9XU96_9FUNG